MGEFVNKHSIKIQVGVLITIIVSIIYYTYTASAFVTQVGTNTKDIGTIKQIIKPVPVLEEAVATMKGDMREIKNDIKSLLRNK